MNNGFGAHEADGISTSLQQINFCKIWVYKRSFQLDKVNLKIKPA